MSRELTFAQAVSEAMSQAMEKDSREIGRAHV